MTLPLFGAPAPLLDVRPRELRAHQERALRMARAHIVGDKKRVLLVGPCGCGKMVIAAHMIRTSTVPALFVTHRRELLDQLVQQLAGLGITNVSVMRGDDDRYQPGASLTLASIQTLRRRDKPKAGLILIDEAHLYIDAYEQLFADYPDAIVVGFTATPTRLDGKPLGALYDMMEIIELPSKLIAQGYLAAADCYSTPTPPDLSGVSIQLGDFVEDQLAEVMNTGQLVGDVVQQWLRLAHRHPKMRYMAEHEGYRTRNYVERIDGLEDGPRRSTIVFATSVAHSKAIAQRFQEVGVRAAHLDGKTPEAERAAILAALASGELEVVCNCAILTEGTDIPSVKCIVHARPTLSLVLWLQTTGRALRPWCRQCRRSCSEPRHASEVPLILDHGGNVDRHGLPHEDRVWSLQSRPSRARGHQPMRVCRGCFAYIGISRVLCPFCGAEQPRVDPREIPRESPEELQLRREKTPEEQRKAFFTKHVFIARAKGFKPGFASAKYKDEYGEWPPYAWSDEVKASFENDQLWQDNMKKRLERKAHEEEEAKQAESRIAEMEAQEPAPEGDESFGDWLVDQGIGGEEPF